MASLRELADVRNPSSLSNRLRAARFEKFERLTRSITRPMTILDIGGTTEFWRRRGWLGREDVTITLVNTTAEEQVCENIIPTTGDATDLRAHGDKTYDIAFSNSVIEHLFTLDKQRAMANEVRRVAHAHWVQTPNYWFPIEPHFHVPGWQWLPRRARIAVLRRRRCGHRGPCPDPTTAAKMVDEVRLMTKRDVRVCFPDSTIWAERFGGITKSWVAYGGFRSE